MQRDFIQNLIEWKDSKRRKPLILTGVRQCGKTYLLKEFGSEYFDNFCYINFESAGKYSAIFEYDYDVKRILREIELAENVKITAGKTLLIFDEIQECPKAITSLKYFCENLQELYAKPFVQTLFSKNNELSSHRFCLQSVCYQTCFVNFIRSFVVQPLMNPFTIEELYKFPETFSQFLCA